MYKILSFLEKAETINNIQHLLGDPGYNDSLCKMFQVLANHTHLLPSKFSNDTDSICSQIHFYLSSRLLTYLPDFTMHSETQLLQM